MSHIRQLSVKIRTCLRDIYFTSIIHSPERCGNRHITSGRMARTATSSDGAHFARYLVHRSSHSSRSSREGTGHSARNPPQPDFLFTREETVTRSTMSRACVALSFREAARPRGEPSHLIGSRRVEPWEPANRPRALSTAGGHPAAYARTRSKGTSPARRVVVCLRRRSALAVLSAGARGTRYPYLRYRYSRIHPVSLGRARSNREALRASASSRTLVPSIGSTAPRAEYARDPASVRVFFGRRIRRAIRSCEAHRRIRVWIAITFPVSEPFGHRLLIINRDFGKQTEADGAHEIRHEPLAGGSEWSRLAGSGERSRHEPIACGRSFVHAARWSEWYSRRRRRARKFSPFPCNIHQRSLTPLCVDATKGASDCDVEFLSDGTPRLVREFFAAHSASHKLPAGNHDLVAWSINNIILHSRDLGVARHLISIAYLSPNRIFISRSYRAESNTSAERGTHRQRSALRWMILVGNC